MATVVELASEAVRMLVDSYTAQAKTLVTPVANVKGYGAKGDGITDDTVAILAAVNTGYDVYIPDGTYIIDPTYAGEEGTFGGIKLKSNQTLWMSGGAILKAKAVPNGQYSIIRIWDVENVKIIGGTIQGDRTTHTGTTGEWGFGIDIRGSKNVEIVGVISKDCWGDGFYVGYSTTNAESQNVRIWGCTGDNNRRQGLSIVGCKGGSVKGCTFSSTNGTAPQAGINLEPDTGYVVEGIEVVGNWLLNNIGEGISLVGGAGTVSKNTIAGNVCKGNYSGIKVQISNDNIVSGNDCIEQIASGMAFYTSSRNVITGNNCSRNPGAGIYLYTLVESNISGNTCNENGADGIKVNANSNDNAISGNACIANSQTTTNTADNISIRGGSSRNNINGNTCRRGSLTNYPRYAIGIIDANCDRNLISNNDCYQGGYSVSISNAGTNTSYGAGNRIQDGTWSTVAG